MDATTTNNNKDNNSKAKSVHLVFQRFRHCRLLLNEDTVVHVGLSESGSSRGSGNNKNDDHDNSIDQLLLNPCNATTTTTDTDTDTDAAFESSSKDVVVGLLVYVSFANTATKESVYNAAKTVLNLPIITLGSWGDGTSTQSLLQIAAAAANNRESRDMTTAATVKKKTTTTDDSSNSSSSSSSPYYNVNLVIVPQANLISKVKSNGKSIQYHGQCNKTVGEEHYDYFIKSLHDIATEYQAMTRKEEKRKDLYNDKSKKKNKSTNKSNNDLDIASIPPKEYFRYIDNNNKDNSKYGSYDATTGIPQTSADGEPLTKSAIKKIFKLYDIQCKKYEKYIEKQQQKEKEEKEEEVNKKENTEQHQQKEVVVVGNTATATVTTTTATTSRTTYELDSNFLHVVAGTFGKRQGLSITSDMGPFCHVVQI